MARHLWAVCRSRAALCPVDVRRSASRLRIASRGNPVFHREDYPKRGTGCRLCLVTSAYHTALRKFYSGRVRIIEGYYSLTKVRAPRIDDAAPDRQPRDCDRVSVWKLEEKQSDVKLAINAYHDALTGEIDHAVIVSNDTDLAPAVRMICANTSVAVGLVVPTRDRARRPNADLAKHCHWVRTHLTDQELAAAQLPRVVPGGKKPTVKPDSWYPCPELFQQAVQLAIGVRGTRSAAFKWFDTPSPFFGGQPPMALMATEEGLSRVIEYMRDWISESTGR